MKTINLAWFKRDLRLLDNHMLHSATQENIAVLPFYIFDNWHTQYPEFSPGRRQFIEASLKILSDELQKLNSKLLVFEGDAFCIVENLVKELLDNNYKPTLYFSLDIQYEYDKDLNNKITQLFKNLGLSIVQCFNDFRLEDEALMDFWRDKYYEYQNTVIYKSPAQINSCEYKLNYELETKLIDVNQSKFSNSLFKAGEPEAIKQLESFLDERYNGYHWKLSRPWLASRGATSHLAPHLAQGAISSRLVYQKVRALRKSLNDEKKKFSLAAFGDRLRWRDSFRQRYIFHPEWTTQNRFAEFDEIYSEKPLSEEKQILYQSWCNGQTGFPMVDASMRQLKKEGWMIFRMRAMCATFLTINCGISWHYGAQHFMNCLIDGDAAIDHWQWQMQAGVTNPLNGAFHIYSPSKNMQERDPELSYIKYWIPELKEFSVQEIVEGDYLSKSDYPLPVLDWAKTKLVNGKKISELRKKVEQRLLENKDSEFAQAVIAKRVVKKYYEKQEAKYEKTKDVYQLKFDFG
jgi:deoxyribodipyrimidine photo-lyase